MSIILPHIKEIKNNLKWLPRQRKTLFEHENYKLFLESKFCSGADYECLT